MHLKQHQYQQESKNIIYQKQAILRRDPTHMVLKIKIYLGVNQIKRKLISPIKEELHDLGSPYFTTYFQESKH